MTIILEGNPISVNSMYRGRRFLTNEGKMIKESNAWQAKSQWKKKALEGKVEISVSFFFPDERRHDIDNCLKALLDSLTGILWHDDSQIYKATLCKEIDRKNPRVEISAVSID